jgi:TRAP-type uncharacterized transport system substrate-binding protein
MRVFAPCSRYLGLLLLASIFQSGSFESAICPPAQAQTIPKALEQSGTDAVVRNRKNNWTVGIAGGQLSGTYMTFANELAEVLDDGDNLRIIPVVTYGAASNMDDLLYLRQIDVAITQSDVFDYFRTQRKIANLPHQVQYILRLPVSEVHVLAGPSINSLEDLRGRKVSFGPAGSASSLTGTIVFQRLGITVDQVLVDNSTALQKLKSGELAALIRVIGKPIDFFARIPPGSGLHFLSIPFSKLFADYYAVSEFTSKEYPSLVPEGQPVETLGVPAVLAVYNWAEGSDRYRRVERFTEALFTKWEKFREPPRHPKWRDVNLAATVPGWTRSNVAEAMLRRLRGHDAVAEQATSNDFSAFLKSKGPAFANLTPEQRDSIFREFLTWQKQRNARQQ